MIRKKIVPTVYKHTRDAWHPENLRLTNVQEFCVTKYDHNINDIL